MDVLIGFPEMMLTLFSLFGFDGFIDGEAYDMIALKMKGDGRCYISTIYTENWVNSPGQLEDNSWQAFAFIPKYNWYIARASSAFYF
ncbi:NADH:ubiquinone oxidoreductase intermediate-associated protein 30 [Dillenia turbinata]|uniref:NADH:ubiquinone oxidoreductase intermediate-associated protein 30 n=1 Tax=Dillenia turbinata TaxID=194707 RepID=A0AAN8UD78_9MAGN